MVSRKPQLFEIGALFDFPVRRYLEDEGADRHYLAADDFSIRDIPAATTAYRWLMLDIDRPKLPKLAQCTIA